MPSKTYGVALPRDARSDGAALELLPIRGLALHTVALRRRAPRPPARSWRPPTLAAGIPARGARDRFGNKNLHQSRNPTLPQNLSPKTKIRASGFLVS